jgi:hypothetical protein
MSEARGAKPRTKGLGAWVLGQRGGALIEFVLVLPLFIILVFGSFAVWKVVSAKQSLASGTYQAARYLSVEGRFLDYAPDLDDDPDDWQDAARVIIVRELENNSLLRPLPQPVITIESRNPPSPPKCPERRCTESSRAVDPCLLDALFTVQAEINLPWSVHIPFLDPEPITLAEKRTSYIECGSILGPTPTPTPTTTPTP